MMAAVRWYRISVDIKLIDFVHPTGIRYFHNSRSLGRKIYFLLWAVSRHLRIGNVTQMCTETRSGLFLHISKAEKSQFTAKHFSVFPWIWIAFIIIYLLFRFIIFHGGHFYCYELGSKPSSRILFLWARFFRYFLCLINYWTDPTFFSIQSNQIMYANTEKYTCKG